MAGAPRVWRVVGLLCLVVGYSLGQEVLPVDGPVPGDLARDFEVNLTDGRVFSFEQRAVTHRPLVVFVFNASDPFDGAMLGYANGSQEFFALNASLPVDFLFLGSDAESLVYLKNWRAQELQKLPSALALQWASKLMIAAAPVPDLLAHDPTHALLNTLASWTTLTRAIAWSSLDGNWTSTVRLDGRFQYCNVVEWTNHSPSSPTQAWPAAGLQLKLIENPCAPVPENLVSLVGLADLTGHAGCSADEAAQYIMGSNATGVVVMVDDAPSSFPLLGQGSFEDNGLWDGNDDHGFCSAIARHDSLLKQLRNSQAVNMTYVTAPRAGAFIGLDHQGRWAEMGAPINPTLMLLGWQAEFLDYQQRLAQNLSRPALEVPIFTPAIGEQASATVVIPVQASNASLIWLEARMSCQGSFDLDCDMWDHVHTVSVTCDGKPSTSGVGEQDVQASEIGRWVTPYRRRVGHWLTDVTTYGAQLRPGARCQFNLSATDNGSPWVFKLSLRYPLDNDPGLLHGVPVAMNRLFNTSELSTFDGTYNTRDALQIAAPAQLPAGQRRAYLTAIITGHGSMEFVPSNHTFLVNGHAFSVAFLEPLDQMACARRAAEGVEPNGHGAIWFGRDGWCNGMKVDSWLADVTTAIADSNTIEYQAFQYDTGRWVQPNSTDGYMRVTSNLVWVQAP
ncbi:uncharacterized protein MONBRDRAFT_27478 [Monosiga brevicollis MX1]|uniref:Peptide-N-glycosidase F N-terminal domain-containing protein n=1 Tax=Monosiga brevicollis TaxID=81824 RepID=A9V5E1_MONBE|nr:uncharacterized protein MONBRDRAFT_27478 [Monosiga brevicollis MX1]EDQ87266.1 predicted protein [Monosiga brevicollis MX1]|eukprot:XP_001747879.1 hypothetical protein [Monosiga brevicollis MX1]